MRWPVGRRWIIVALAAVLAVGAAATVIYRVLAPAEVDTVARGAYPAAPTPQVGVIGRLPVAPLVVDGRLRVYAGARQVYADQPVDGRHRVTPFWSYRRWPAQLVGVLADDTTVVSRWSDGLLVALDARTGRVAWRADGPAPGPVAKPRRTYASTVWDPAGLHVTGTADGRRVLVAAGPGRVAGYALADGRQLWRADVGDDCRTDVGTTAAGELLAVDACAGPATVEFRDAATGQVRTRWQPPGGPPELTVTLVGCRNVRSECRGLRTAGPGDDAGRGWLIGAGEPVAAPALDGPGAELADELVVGVHGGVLTGRSARTGAELWRRPDLGPVRILAVQPGRVHLLTERNDLVTLDPATGAERSRFPMDIGRDGTGWVPGRAYAGDGYVAVERVRERAGPDDDDQAYFLMPEAVLLAAS
ncbi:PQQ-like beta-propeller repeat protein [Micromonospora sp. DR5-3]|uniref:outer membrane protein assembly factor BamB family protein n=1 Tax=unclassified Micromonospora TaxID=2617518 RepID=UPI0011D8F4E0|nr:MULTISPECIES: PQQ-binding-like beta-propeller repeat protein [unclassified Micromonospora]MCW3813068.1 PQQ-like beta-propeller repeat protein [Micromonospora sp. DR5-3]TYC25947.1 PQQ-binding-like beta-propeller repeat protein [Micromonospora sp. MP36]